MKTAAALSIIANDIESNSDDTLRHIFFHPIYGTMVRFASGVNACFLITS